MKEVILDSETVIWASGAPIPRHEMIKIVVSKTPLKDEDIRVNIFDCLYYNGKSLIDLPWKERQTYLKKVLPKDTKHLKRVIPCIVTDRKSFDRCYKQCTTYAGSEGLMAKSTESKYPLTGRTGDWAKMKLAKEIKASVIGMLKKPFPLRPAPKLEAVFSDHKLTPGDLTLKWNASKKKWQGTEDPRIWQMAKGFSPGKRGEYAYGNTYGKKLDPGPRMGTIVTVRPIMVRKFKTDGVTRFSWMFPNLREIDPTRNVPDTIDDMERIARESAARTPGKKAQMEIMEAIHRY
ncbi:DNA ligase [subsurface metagenome]